jgi:putative ABC transport system substrate-binding protein
MIARRRLCCGLAATAVLPRVSRAQTGDQLPVIAVLSWWAFGTAGGPVDVDFLDALRRHDWVDGETARIEFHWAGGDGEKARAMAAELVRRKVRIIVAQATPAALIAKAATRTIPIVFRVADPMASNLVSNLARPGGNLTGASIMSTELSGKRIELLREIIPGLSRVAFLGYSRDPNGPIFAEQTEAAAARLGILARRHMVDVPSDYPSAVRAIVGDKAQAVVVQPIFASQRDDLVAIAIKNRLPMISDQREFAMAGFPLAYGADPLSNVRVAAEYVDRILRGAAPGDLPVQQPTEFRLILNMRTARRLDLAIPYSVMARADEIIE